MKRQKPEKTIFATFCKKEEKKLKKH